eukprot:scaffold22644_cov44-Cyclotella_meneghiniana.AAC.6
MSECLHPLGSLLSGKFDTLDNAPRQSDTISTEPCNWGSSLFAASNTRWIASKPSNSPLYAHASLDCSGKLPMIHPRPAVHSSTNPLEHASLVISLI